jgi:protein involved in polysaccharide export with SLBB domain
MLMRWNPAIVIGFWGVVCFSSVFAQQNSSSDADTQLAPLAAPRLRIGPLIQPLPSNPPSVAPRATLPSIASPELPDLTQLAPKTNSAAENIKAAPPGYVIRTGDLIHFRVLDEDDMDLTLRVGKDGTVHIPYINSASVGGKTVNQCMEEITKALRVYYISPIVSFELLEFAPNTVTILGQVNRPGVITLPPQVESISLMDAIARAEGTNAIADLGNVTVKRFVNGGEQVIKVDGRPMARGMPGAHFEILSGDTVIVALTNNQFKVLGEVRNPGIFTLPPLTDSIDLGDALAMAGGGSSDLGEVTIKRTEDGKESVISLDKATMRGYSRNEKSGEHFMVRSGDTIEVKMAKVDFVILGQVSRPGVYQIPAQQDSISVLEALAMAGGATRLGDLGHVLVRRKVNGVMENLRINVKQIQSSDVQQIFQIFPEDTITVGERLF